MNYFQKNNMFRTNLLGRYMYVQISSWVCPYTINRPGCFVITYTLYIDNI